MTCKIIKLNTPNLQPKEINTEVEQSKGKSLKDIGRERLEKLLPDDIVGIIVAEQRVDKSDTMTDYWGHKTVRTVIIGITMTKRDNFNEMRKCAANFPDTKFLSEKNPKYEHRENYTGGGGYYLGEDRHSGWVIFKEKYYTREGLINRYAEAAADESNIWLTPVKVEEQKEAVSDDDIGNLKLEIVDYSEKSFAIFGDTSKIMEKLYDLGGSYNRSLKYGNNKRPGYIFSKKKEDKVRKELNLPK